MREFGQEEFEELCLNIYNNGDINEIIDDDNYTLLHHACRSNTADLQLVTMLIEKGAYIDCLTTHKNTPLHLVVKWGYKDIFLYLLSKGAKTDIINLSNESPIICAYNEERMDFLKILIQHGATYDGTNEYILRMVEQYAPPEVCYI